MIASAIAYSEEDDDSVWTDLRAVHQRQSAAFPLSSNGRKKEKWLQAQSTVKAAAKFPQIDDQEGHDAPESLKESTTLPSLQSASDGPVLFEGPTLDQPNVFFISTQEWDGHIESVGDDSFEGVIRPVGDGVGYSEDAVTVPFHILEEHVVDMLRPGVLFRMAAGHIRAKRTKIRGVRVYIRKDTARPVSEWLHPDALAAAFGE